MPLFDACVKTEKFFFETVKFFIGYHLERDRVFNWAQTTDIQFK